MEISLTPEHEELRQTVRRFLEKESTEAAVRAAMETERGYDTRVWERLAAEMALPGLAVAESAGGAGFGAVELAIVMEEMGRVLFCGPFLSTAVLAVGALNAAAKDSPALAEIAAGKLVATLAVSDGIEASRDGSAWRIDGVAGFVLDGHVADLILVAARTADGVGLFGVEGRASHLERKALPTLDLTRKLARVSFSGTPAARLGGGDASAAIEHATALAATALAAEQVGGAQRCLEMSTEYAKTRLQFGRPIGSYQAIKHRCADMLVEVELARSAAYAAAFAAASDDEAAFREAASVAKSYCSEAFFKAAGDTIQIHGGMGFTWEHPAHLYFKRAKASSILFGDPIEHRRRLAERIGI